MTMKLGLIGCGGMGLRHAYGYAEFRKYFDSFELAAVCDLHESAAQHVASEVQHLTGTRPTVFTDINQMMEARAVDAIDIVTDTRMHHSFALLAFDAGIHVMTEKPMGLTIRACLKMQEAATQARKTLSVAENYRRDPMNRLAQALLVSGLIGTPQMLIKIGVGGGSSLMHNTGWRALKSRAGGMILEQGVHDADLIQFFLGSVDTVDAITGILAPIRKRTRMNPNLASFYAHRVEDEFVDQDEVEIDQEDTALAILRFSSGAFGEYGISNAARGFGVGADTIHGTAGTMAMPRSRTGRSPGVYLEGRKEPLNAEDLLTSVPDWELDDITAKVWDGARRIASYDFPFGDVDRKLIAIEYEEFAQSILNNTKPEVDSEAGMSALALAYALLESGALRAPVALRDVLSGSVREYQRAIDDTVGL